MTDTLIVVPEFAECRALLSQDWSDINVMALNFVYNKCLSTPSSFIFQLLITTER